MTTKRRTVRFPGTMMPSHSACWLSRAGALHGATRSAGLSSSLFSIHATHAPRLGDSHSAMHPRGQHADPTAASGLARKAK